MKGYVFLISYLLVILSINAIHVNAESMLNWIWGKKEESALLLDDGIPLVSIPYELLTEDEKFLKEASKLITDIQISSPLEICQHKVVLKIKSACTSMTEEQLAKLSVNLLNCQSAAEGRKLFPCTDKMTIKECTIEMDSDTWNSYHLISNRARAVCYSARSYQFRALVEITVNKLMQSAHTQIKTLASLKESQDYLEKQTVAAHKIIKLNMQDLTNEKALIRTGHSQLATMTEDIKMKLEKANQDFIQQAAHRSEYHQEILTDLKDIQIQVQLLWQNIENSTNHIIKQNYETIIQYEKTLTKIKKINQTIVFIWNLTNIVQSEIDERLEWITEYIGTAGENVDKIYRISLHVVYLFATMIIATFLQAPFLTRTAILGLIPINFISYLKHGLSASIDFISLTFLLLFITAIHYLFSGIQYLLRLKNKIIKTNSKLYGISLLNNKQMFVESMKKNHRFKYQEHKLSSRLNILQLAVNLWCYIHQHIFKYIVLGNLKIFKKCYHIMKSWMWQEFEPIEELSCSYVSAKKYNEYIVSSTKYPNVSDDSSEYSDSPNSEKFIPSNDNSIRGAVLKRRNLKNYVSPLTAFFKGNREDTQTSQQSVTPIRRTLCQAKTRSGNPCRLLTLKSQKYCFKHADLYSE
ncbi:PREDICTED: protein brambleberry-like [Ceratosolen solmsi marchali]|uniref:Protein brambleberry-like n=1 Tax=Ceratosolen solmsi marchali TaxID=326594 RepID=A0AAJ6YJT2_9HYME|nr:PREDICTED: protein brambleberry-like [Ceratosolen solmsi marchali]